MKKSRDNLRNTNGKGIIQNSKATLSASNNSDSQSNFNSRSKKKCDEKAVILDINASNNKNSSKDGTFKVHHYRKDYDPILNIETSQFIIKKKDQLIALDKYIFGNNPNNNKSKLLEKKVSIVGINPENQPSGKITPSHKRKVKNPNPKPGQITATAVLTPDGLYQQISSTDGEYVTVDSSAPVESIDSSSNIVQRQKKVKLDSSFESSDIFKKKLSPTKLIQAEIESSFVDSNIGISPRNPHGLWKNNQQNEVIEVEYEYVTYDEEEDIEKSIKKQEASMDNASNQIKEEIEYEIIEEEEEEEEAELEPANNNQSSIFGKEEEEEYEYVFEEDENEDKNQLVPSNSLRDVQPLNTIQKKQASIIANDTNNHPSDYDEENDYATTEDNINTQSFMISEQNKAKKEKVNFEEEEQEAEIEESNAPNENQSQEEGIEEANQEDENEKDLNVDNIGNNTINQQENQIHESNDSLKKELQLSASKSDKNVESASDKTKNKELNTSSKLEKKIKFVENETNISESINVNDVQFSTANQFGQKDSEPTVSIFEEYVFSDEKEKKNEEKQKAKLAIVSENQSISKINDSSFGFNNSQMQERNETQISNTINNLVKNRNQIIKSEIESTEININIVDELDKTQNSNNPNNSSSPSKTAKRLFLSPSNAVESRSGTTENDTVKNKNESSHDEKEKPKNKLNLQAQFEFESSTNDNNQQFHSQPNEESNKAKEVTNDQTLATCDLDMSNLQRSPPAKENKGRCSNNNSRNDHNSDDYYSHEYYTTMETNEISNHRGRNSPNSKNSRNSNKNSNRNRNSNNDSYYSYSYYSDTYTYSYDPSTIDAKQRKSRHRHRRHNNEYTYEYVTNGKYEAKDRGVRPVNDRSNQLPPELQQQIQQQLQQQIQLHSTPQSNQSTPYSIRLHVKDGQQRLFDIDNGKSPKFILRTVSKDGKATPHNIELVIEDKNSSSQTPVHSTAASATQTAATSVPTSPLSSKGENQNVKFELPQVIQSGPHKGLIKRRIKKSEKAQREKEKQLKKVEEEIKKMEQYLVEQDKKKQAIANASVEVNPSIIIDEQNLPLSKSSSENLKRTVSGKKPVKAATSASTPNIIQNNERRVQARNPPLTASRSSRAISSSSVNSPNKRYYDENGNPALVEVSDATGRPVFRRIVSKSSASSSVKHGGPNPNAKAVTQSLPRPVKSRNVAGLEFEQQEKQDLYGTPKRSSRMKFPLNNDFGEDDKNSLKKSPAKNVQVNHEIHVNNDAISDSDSDIDSDDEDFLDSNNKNVENRMKFGEVYRSRNAPHIKKAKFQNPQIYLKPRKGNAAGPSAGSTSLKRAVFDSDSDSDEDDIDDGKFEMRNLSPNTKQRKREELTKEIEHLRQMLPGQPVNEDKKDESNKYSSNKQINKKPPSIPSSQQRQPKRYVNDEEYDPFEDFDENLDNLQKSPYDPRQNLNNNNNNRYKINRPPIQLNPTNRHPSDGSASSLTERRKMPKITVEIPSKGNAGQADVFRRHYENASPEKVSKKTPDRYRDFNEYDDDDSVPLNASTKNASKNLEDENQDEHEDGNQSGSSNFSSKKRVRRRFRVSVHDGSRSPAPHSSNPLKDSSPEQKDQLQSNNAKSSNSNTSSPSKKQRENVKPLIDTFKENLRQKLNLSDDYDDEKLPEVHKNVDPDSAIGAMNPVQAMKHEESKKKKSNPNEVAPLTPPPDVDFNQSSSMLSNAPPPSPKNQDVEIVIRNGKRKRKKKISLSPSNKSTHSHSSRNSGTRGNVIRSHHLKDSEKYQIESPPPSVLSSIVEDDIDE